MRRATISLGIAAAVLLLVPWQICDCAEDGPHLKFLWDHSSCAEAPTDDDGAPAEDDCDELFFHAAVRAASEGPDAPAQTGLDVRLTAPAAVEGTVEVDRLSPLPVEGAPPRPPLLSRTRLLL